MVIDLGILLLWDVLIIDHPVTIDVCNADKSLDLAKIR